MDWRHDVAQAVWLAYYASSGIIGYNPADSMTKAEQPANHYFVEVMATNVLSHPIEEHLGEGKIFQVAGQSSGRCVTFAYYAPSTTSLVGDHRLT